MTRKCRVLGENVHYSISPYRVNTRVVFMIGAMLGMIAILALTRIESWITERYSDQE